MSLDNTFYAPAISSLAEAKAMALEQLAKINEAHQLAGVIVDSILASPPASEAVFATDAGTRQSLWAIFRALEKGTFASSYWVDESGVPHELLPSSTDDFCMQAALGITDYISDCQINADTLTTAINAAASINAVLNIDLSAGWPSRTLAGGLTFTEGGGGGCQVDEYTTAGTHTWTKPSGAVSVMVELVGGGGGGASGERRASGVTSHGGSGGGGGAFTRMWLNADELEATCSVDVGAGGTGGASVTTDGTDGNDGNDGGHSEFYDSNISVDAIGGYAGLTPGGGSSVDGGGGGFSIGRHGWHGEYTMYTNPFTLKTTFGGNGGENVDGSFGGGAEYGGGGGGGISLDGHLKVNFGAALANCQFSGGPSLHGGGGGGAGGSVTSGNVAQKGGLGGRHGYGEHQIRVGDTTGSGANGIAGEVNNYMPMAISGGGWGGDAATAAASGSGGAGGRGGGGGGGAGSRNGYASGAGGDGGDGYVRVTTWYNA